MIKNFRNLQIWKRSRVLVKAVYKITSKFPAEEKYALTSQLKRSSISIPSNIAEGCGRKTEKDLSRFLDMAIGSTCEAETQICLGFDLGFLTEETMNKAVTEIGEIRKMIIGYQKTLKVS